MLLFKIALAVLVIWFLADAIPLVYESRESQRWAFTGLTFLA
jgi:hypothetical protein